MRLLLETIGTTAVETMVLASMDFAGIWLSRVGIAHHSAETTEPQRWAVPTLPRTQRMQLPHFAFPLLFGLILPTVPVACSTGQPADEAAATAPPASEAAVAAPDQAARFTVLAGGQSLDPDTALAALANNRVVFIGENHERYDHHLNQLALIRHLHQADPQLTIGLEMFQQPAQPHLDAYIAGRLDEQQLLEKSGYFNHWGYDYRLYRPILRYAREHRIPLLALNVPTAVSRKVARSGLSGLTAEERGWVPAQIDRSDTAYRDRLKTVYDQHRGLLDTDFEHFLEAQLLWDEAMAERAARYLKEHPKRRLAVLAGNGHLVYGAGIPRRLQQRLPVAAAIVLQAEGNSDDRQGADYWLVSAPLTLPPSGRLGLLLDAMALGRGLKIQNVLPDSGAQRAGIQDNDRLIGIGGRQVRSMADVRLALLDKRPGEPVPVTIRRGQGDTAPELVLNVMLQED